MCSEGDYNILTTLGVFFLFLSSCFSCFTCVLKKSTKYIKCRTIFEISKKKTIIKPNNLILPILHQTFCPKDKESLIVIVSHGGKIEEMTGVYLDNVGAVLQKIEKIVLFGQFSTNGIYFRMPIPTSGIPDLGNSPNF